MADATIILRATDDATQQIWDLHHLGGEDRIENADRLRDALLDGSLMTLR